MSRKERREWLIEWYSIPVGKYLIDVSSFTRREWKHCEECDLCTKKVTRVYLSWKDSLISTFEIPHDCSWSVIHAIEQTLKGLI